MKNRAKEISLLVERNRFYVLGIHGKPYSLMPLMSEFDFSVIGHATDGLPSSKAEHSAEEKMTAKQTEAPQAYYETEAGPICFLTDNDELPAAMPASQTGQKRSTQAVLLLQPLPISNISYAELVGDHLYFISQNKLWLLRDPFQDSAADAERLPLQEARPVFLFQNGSDLHVLLKHETTELWKKSGGQWERECLWSYGAPQLYADTGKSGCLILSAMDNGLSVLHLAQDGSISELSGSLFGGEPKSINMLRSTIYISTANPFGIAECAVNELERWAQSGREGNPFQFSPLAIGHGICNMLENNQDIIVARSGRTELKTLSGETVFLDEENGQCGYLASAMLTPPAAHGFHIVGTGMRDEKHPRTVLYVLNPHLKAVLKKRGEMTPVNPYCGYSRRNRSPVANKSVIANTAGWPVLIAAYESHEQFREDQIATGLRVEYVDRDIIIYSRDSMFAGHNDASSGCFLSVSPKSKDKISYDSGFYKSGQTGWPFCRLIRKATTNVPLPAALPFPEIRLKYEDMGNCDFTSLIPTQYRIEWNGVHFDFLIHPKSPGKNVVALGTGHVDKRRQAVPQYSRYTWGSDLGASCIWYSDPVLYLKPGGLYWGYGLKDRWFLKDLAHLITIIASKIGGGNANLLFFGSSGGGFTSIALAILTRTIAFAINPQLDCLSYSETTTKCFMDTCMAPNEQPDQIRLNVVRLIAKEGYCPEIFILQNLTAGHDITNQIVPFIIACEQLEFSGNPIHISFYKAAGGHNAQPPRDLVIQRIHEILSHALTQGTGS